MPSHLPPLHLILTGPGRIGAGLAPLLRADGHTLRILTRADYGDFADPAFDPRTAVDALPEAPAPEAPAPLPEAPDAGTPDVADACAAVLGGMAEVPAAILGRAAVLA